MLTSSQLKRFENNWRAFYKHFKTLSTFFYKKERLKGFF